MLQNDFVKIMFEKSCRRISDGTVELLQESEDEILMILRKDLLENLRRDFKSIFRIKSSINSAKKISSL